MPAGSERCAGMCTSASVESSELACTARVSGWQRSTPGTPLRCRTGTHRCRTDSWKALWDNGFTPAGPRLAYAKARCIAISIGVAAMPARSGRQHKKYTGSFTMPAVHQPALPHMQARHPAAARLGGSVPFRCMARAQHAQHAARCMHASAERRLQARSPLGMHGPGRWPFHACAICAPPASRARRF
ncbi:conserved protein of unknown function [Cupriavidus taiwanensis]|uniref:Uncharacterized protein n=1 Tax=Cupriavidus taiwanensis TaxID=164546 RepID=A0A375DHG8_9BURK|nr:conserved protein of unknown function [Cupriavidus taiwanensis]SOZ01664.1 conserved hypothetical protein [Cupriavidus taiwanensis]SOZ04695.1 conserved hypothetical protein [Cupriavidus taiwanensis]SPC06889.1 conserved hypothetical protein [Cupriavidus taiwanensis]SPC09176.1 conserved hypothetical protein [Cupriavidus taiwanensis]